MSNASLKEQLQAVASQLSDKLISPVSPVSPKPNKENKPRRKFQQPENAPTKPKPQWLDYVQYGVELLRAYFPGGFKAPNEVKPLKKGIKQDLVKRLSTMETIVTEDKACMVKSLSYYVNTAAYHKNMTEGIMRVDLDGNPAEAVTAEEAKYSFDKNQAKMLARQNQKAGVKPQQTKEIKEAELA